MVRGRRDALKRLQGLASPIESHLDKITSDPQSQDVPHWKQEIANWLRQMEAVLSEVGKKTRAEWAGRLAGWKARLGD